MENSNNSTATPMTATLFFYRGTDVWVIMLSLLAAVLWIYTHRVQPAKSRLFIPLVSSISLLFFHASLFITFFLGSYGANILGKRTESIILSVLSLIQGASYFGVSSGLCLQILRFIILQNLTSAQISYLIEQKNQNKISDTASRSDELMNQMKRRARIYQILLSKPILFMVLTLLMLIYLVGGISIMTAEIVVQLDQVFQLIYTMVLILSCLLFAMLVILIDTIRNAKYLKNPSAYLLERDRLLFRVDFFLGFIGAIMFVIVQGGSFIFSLHILLTIIGFIIQIIKYTILFLALQGGLASIVSIYNQPIRFFNRSKNDEKLAINEELLGLLSHDAGVKIFETYAHSEYNIENIECWKKIQESKRLSKGNLKNQLKEIYETFVEPGSALEVNLPSDVRQEMTMIGESNQDNQELSEKLKSLEIVVAGNLTDTFFRLKRTMAYAQFKMSSSIAKQNEMS